MKHVINWFEIAVSNFDRAVHFYEAIFQITLDQQVLAPEFKMAVFPHEGDEVGGSLVLNPEFYTPSENGSLIYLNGNPDLAIVESRVVEAGGEIIIPKRMISPDHGFMAVIKDTEGNRIALHSDN